MKVEVSILEPIRENLSWEEKWRGQTRIIRTDINLQTAHLRGRQPNHGK